MNSQRSNQNWLWWYDGIIDWMLDNPGKKIKDCAAHFNKAPSTIGYIVNSDAFRMRLAARRKEFEGIHDYMLASKTAEVALRALDCMIDTLEKKRDTIPLKAASEVANSALERLGFGVKPTTINIGNGAGATVVQVSRETLEKSRAAIRQVQQQRLLEVADAPAERRGMAVEAEVDSGEIVDATVVPSTV